MKRHIVGIVAAGLVLLLGACVYAGCEQRQMQQEIAGKILRFHVLANSDSKEDQALKLQVRDAVGVLMADRLSGVEEMAQCRQIVSENLGIITDTARETIAREGYHYDVTAKLADVDFPVKTYGEYSFPAGTYEALEIVIGQGEGHNWWCVMYPNMCFAGSTYAVVEEKAKVELEHTLTQEEYESLIEEKDYTVKFRYLTFLNKYLK